MKKLLCLFLVALPLSVAAREATVTSPGGHLTVTIDDQNGRPTYAVALDGRQMLLPSALGFTANFGDFTRNLHITGTRAENVDRSYDMWQAKQRHFHYVATLLCVDFENADGQKMTVEFSVSDNDVALRYAIPRQKKDRPLGAIITSEQTAFRLPDGTTTFLSPQSDPMVGWERTKPSYEEEYTPDAPLSAKSKYGRGYTFPCLFKTPAAADGANGWVLLSETGVSSQYCGSHISDYDAAKGYTIAYPMPEENNGFGSATAVISLPGKTPWRTITVGASLKPIVETTVQYDVVEPLYEPSQTYRSGRYTWSWLIWQDASINWADQVKFIDLAATMGYEYCLVDNYWDTNIGRDRMADLSKYAQSKGVSLMLWYNSNGAENDAPQGPRDCMNTTIARNREMRWLQQIGVKGIKVDFFGGDKQETMRLYEDILADANRYGLAVVFHGCTLPRGWERMYPNYVSSEAVLASENVYFTDYHAKAEPFQLTMHPFCRNASATIDWGGIIMNTHMAKDNSSRHERHTTNVFELATGITNQTPVQCVAVQPNNPDELNDVEMAFLRALPTTWDETRFIDGYPGRYVVLARRHGSQWYVAGLNGQAEPLTLQLDLSFLSQPTLIIDQPAKKGGTLSTVSMPLKAGKRGLSKVTLQPAGGLLITGSAK